MNLPDIWRDIGSRIGFYTKETADQIPESPGIYAWFLPLWMFSDNLDHFYAIAKRTLLHDPLREDGKPIRETSVPFAWDTITVTLKRGVARGISDDLRQRWDCMLEDPELRGTFALALMESSLLLPPLYVGKTDDLSVRYQQHTGSAGGPTGFFQRFRRFVETQGGGPSLGVHDLLFVCIQTDSAQNRRLRDRGLNVLLEQLIMRLAGPPFSVK